MPDLPTGGLNRPSGRAAPREQEQTLVGWNRCLRQLGLPASAEPGSRSEEALKLLGSWAATVDRSESARSTYQS
jgi:hypothetical protein